MKSLVGLLLLPGIVCQFTAPPQLTPTLKPARGCCAGTQFSATLTEVGGQIDPASGNRTFIDTTVDIHYNYGNLKLAVVTRSKNGSSDTVTVIDYHTNKMTVKGPGYCVVEDYVGAPMREPCVPSNSTYLGRSYFGSTDTNIEVDTFLLEYPDMTGKVSVTTDGSCIPVFESTLSDKIIDRRTEKWKEEADVTQEEGAL